jgi:hypothetical protein
VFIRNISRILEGLIYILLGVTVATIIITLFVLPTNDFAEVIEEITEISLFIIIILLPVPALSKKYISGSNDPGLIKLVYVLKNIHIALGILFVALHILHVEVNLLSESIEWSMETITSILFSIILIPTVIYAILRIKNSEKYRKLHRFFLTLTYITFVVHLFH